MTGPRPVGPTWCIVPRELAGDLHEYLVEYWRDHPSIRVVLEHRERERRRSPRRTADDPPPGSGERRLTRSESGRRLLERRARTVAADPPMLPVRARRHADQLVFVRRVPASEQQLRDAESLQLVLRVQSGDQSAFADLYLAHFDHVCSYLRTAIGDYHEAEDVTQRVFLRVLRALPQYQIRRGTPFRAWLFRIARNEALRHLGKHGVVEVEDPTTVERRRERDVEDPPGAWDWVSDADLAAQLERLPLAQRQALTLRHLVGLNVHEIAMVLDRTPEAVRMLEHRAMRSLRDRLTEAGFRSPGTLQGRTSMLARVRLAPVLRGRRFALNTGRGSTPALSSAPALSAGTAAWRSR